MSHQQFRNGCAVWVEPLFAVGLLEAIAVIAHGERSVGMGQNFYRESFSADGLEINFSATL